MKNLILNSIVVAVCMQVSGCDFAFTQEQMIKKQVKAMMLDSDAAKFGEITPAKNEKYFCGTVNGKNKMGAYVGYTPFVYEKITNDFGVIAVVGEPPKDYEFSMLKDSSDFESQYKEVLEKCKALISYEENCSKVSVDVPRLCRLMIKDNKGFWKELYKND